MIDHTSKSTTTADYYVYSKKLSLHALIAKPGKVVLYKSPTRTLISHDRVEYFIKKNVIVVRGNPTFINKSPDNNNYTLQGKLMNIKLENSINNINQKTLIFIEDIGSVKFKDDKNEITSDYSIYYDKEKQIEFDNNVTITSDSGVIKGCKAIYNINKKIAEIEPCVNKTSTKVKGFFE